MLATFVIGLREGLEAALIVGIVAAFLRQRGKLDALRYVWLGVLAAVVSCGAIAIGLILLQSELTQQAQEALETVIGLLAVAMVTYMVLWMRKHSRGLKHDLEGAAEHALAQGSAFALVGMAILAVLREGIETVVFLLALFRTAETPALAGVGAALGLVIAIGIGYAIYKGGVRLNLSRFFRITGFVLVLVAAGLLMSAAHTAHSAGWINFGQQQALDLSWLVEPGTIRESLLTGVLGLQPKPTVIEVVVWLVYFIPLALYVCWPAKRQPRPASSTSVERPAP
ncbi:iron uptake transporter permease EfeU [Tenggerimyces flavus]|uniref:Iron uptake transporter permease EfeU n=1 Tax=Tenggerimyces flavus TaxID=1708749 RepID=A0ABV7YJQ3_9ACTN|nr:iron uptake transporter permease EfeU [Tenggerimyces flavus]MBM7789192.1 high-affinity iron transporter [Tenggerimyces flavus]